MGQASVSNRIYSNEYHFRGSPIGNMREILLFMQCPAVNLPIPLILAKIFLFDMTLWDSASLAFSAVKMAYYNP